MEFIGPIHRWLYAKVHMQNQLCDAIVSLAKEQGWDVGPELASCVLPALETLQPGMNVHGWLQDKVQLTEKRLAALVESLLEGHEERFEAIKDAARAFGGKHPVAPTSSAPEVYHTLEDVLLDGMPCDRANQVVSSTPEGLEWKCVRDLHSQFWQDGDRYWAIRDALVDGMVRKCGARVRKTPDGYQIVMGEH